MIQRPSPSLPERTEFTRWVRDVLNRLYDSGYLENHPLVNLLVKPQDRKVQASQQLRRIVLNAIQSTYPGKSTPDHSPDWRSYRILEMRYINGLTAAEAMQQLAMSRSLFFLEQARALEALTDRLWAEAVANQEKEDNTGAARSEPEPVVMTEMERILKSSTSESLDLGEVLDGLSPVLQALVASEKGTLHIQPEVGRKIVQANRVLLRQAILSLVSLGLKIVPAGNVMLQTGEPENPALQITIQPVVKGTAQVFPVESRETLQQCRYTLEAMRARLKTVNLLDGGWQAEVTWLPAAPRQLLVIDDHPDMIDLIWRYLEGLDWGVIGAVSGEEAKSILESLPALPEAIILDVILPKEDGWEFLLSLKTDEKTRAIPVIVCSALHEPGLVSALGGSAFLAKPLTRPALLEALQKAGLNVPGLSS